MKTIYADDISVEQTNGRRNFLITAIEYRQEKHSCFDKRISISIDTVSMFLTTKQAARLARELEELIVNLTAQ